MTIPKKQNLLFLFMLCSCLCFAQKSPVKGFMKDVKKKNKSEVRKVMLGRLPIVMASWFVDEDLKKVLKHARKIRVLNTESSDLITSKDWKSLKTNMDNAGYEKVLALRKDGGDVALHLKDEKEKVKWVTAILSDGGNDTLLEIKTKLSLDQIIQMFTEYVE